MKITFADKYQSLFVSTVVPSRRRGLKMTLTVIIPVGVEKVFVNAN